MGNRVALSGLRTIAKSQFDLELRIGEIKISELSKLGFSVEIAKYQLAPEKTIAIFRGGGILAAEKHIKQNPQYYEIPEFPDATVDLSGLSCRWNPIRSQSGAIVSLLILAKNPDSNKPYQNVLEKLASLYQGNLANANPVKISQMTFKTIGECLSDEIRQHSPKWAKSTLLRFVEIMISAGIFRFHLPLFNFNAKAYQETMPIYSDYRKFDDLLRMVIDCSPEQLDILRNYLQTCHQNDELYYGLHESIDCLMTCYVQSTQNGGHIHFIDGGNGGYAMAARQLKQQLLN